ncbi:hypothetical protein EV643_10739 [Kribbella sp. VKM Ac-2527]|uniref:Uncharacterized protein n=1 Tax=Kribbella caucasensis TaxID=2512215 RepID=A0A4R6KF26_9ACTN|nr:hypothetical protein [Kribbella sp. VKM Ac-2527]TDO48410.1 hypothetical protein EV643_10739 [Kribbella sp. VKM Ac-2527]
MSARVAKWLAWSLFGLFVGLAAATPVLVAVRHGNASDALVAIGIGFALVGALVASRHPTNAVGWLLLVAAVALGLDTFMTVYVSRASLPGAAFAGWFSSWLLFVWLYLPALFLTLVFPAGRLLSRRWRTVVWLGVGAVAANVVGTAFAPGVLDISADRPIRNPLGVEGPVGRALPWVSGAGEVLAGAALVLGGLCLVLRLRRSRGRERQQVTWFAYVCMLALVPFVVLVWVSVLAGDQDAPWLNALALIAWWSLVVLILVGLPSAIGIAILRHQLYDIAVVINRTLVYGALTLTLGASYLGSVLLLQVVLNPLTQGSGLAVAVSTLAVAGLFRPARRRIQLVVDRRFFRHKYDAARTLQAFGSRLRDQLDVDALGNDLQVVVRDTMQPAHVSLWLRRADR